MDGSERVRFPTADGGTVHGRLRMPASPHGSVAVLCHPHPDAGGTMDVWLLPVIGEALAAGGWTVLRFDFRSAGHGVAAGAHERECADLAAALDFLDERGLRAPAGRAALVGWSFGALVAVLHGLDDPRITDWVGIAPPTAPLPELPMAPLPSERLARWAARRTVIAGAHDQFFAVADLDRMHPHVRHVLDDCDHFFFDRDRDVAALVAQALA